MNQSIVLAPTQTYCDVGEHLDNGVLFLGISLFVIGVFILTSFICDKKE